MTATVHPLPVRQPLFDEMMDAFKVALDTPDDTTYRRRFYQGLGLGYAIAFGLVTREALDRARLTPRSLNVHVDFRQPSAFDDEDTLWACGVRHGYALATSERPDANECVTCGERLTDDDNFELCGDGRFCENFECADIFHANGPSVCATDGAA